jgi:hypothetical protein
MASSPKTVLLTGAFDMCTTADLAYLRLAKAFAGEGGRVVAVVENEAQLVAAKGYHFMPLRDRMAVVGQLRYVDEVLASLDAQPGCMVETLRACRAPPTHVLVPCGTRRPAPEAALAAVVYDFGAHIAPASWDVCSSIRTAHRFCASKE